MVETITRLNEAINQIIWGIPMMLLIVGVGLYLSLRLRFLQFRHFGHILKNTVGKAFERSAGHAGAVSPFKAMCTALAASIGTGNIAGVAGAIALGGPGAIFWMWVSAIFGMCTKYAEVTLSIAYRQRNAAGDWVGGPMYYIKNGLGIKWLAAIFAVFAMIACIGTGNATQSNSISSVLNMNFSIAPWITGLVLTVIVGAVILGGVKRIATVNEKLVPIMALLYIVGGLLVLCINVTSLPKAIGMIFKYAFAPQALLGGAFGAAISKAITQGAKRGLFSNEAGMGSTPHAHALADVKDPHEQGASAMIGVFIDTFVVLTMTALVVISTLYCNGTLTPETYALGNAGISNATMAQSAFGFTFAKLFGAEAGAIIGNIFVAICLFFFAFSTILSWNYFGKVNFLHLFGKKSATVYSIIAILFVFLGALFQNDLVWELTDMFNNLMVIPNAIALWALAGMVVTAAKNAKKNSLE